MVVVVVVVVVFPPKFCYLSVGVHGVTYGRLHSQLFQQFAVHIFRLQYIWINFLPTPGHTANMLVSRTVIVLVVSMVCKRYGILVHKYCGEKVNFV